MCSMETGYTTQILIVSSGSGISSRGRNPDDSGRRDTIDTVMHSWRMSGLRLLIVGLSRIRNYLNIWRQLVWAGTCGLQSGRCSERRW